MNRQGWLSCQGFFLCMAMALHGCSSMPEKSHVIAQSAQLTQMPTINVPRPDLVIHTLSSAQRSQPAQLVKAYVATVSQLLDYATQLEAVIDQLQQVNIQEYAP